MEGLIFPSPFGQIVKGLISPKVSGSVLSGISGVTPYFTVGDLIVSSTRITPVGDRATLWLGSYLE